MGTYLRGAVAAALRGDVGSRAIGFVGDDAQLATTRAELDGMMEALTRR